MRATWMPSRDLMMFAVRTALAATLGLICAISLGLHEPHWAAWTVVSVGLATRGDGLLKSFNRVIGTAIGAPAGVLLVFAAHGSPPLLVALLAAWLATCVYLGIASRNYRAYAAVLAGYSAVIVAMSPVGETGQLFEMGRDRCAGIFIGIACALALLLLSRDVQTGQASQRIRRVIAAACQWSADRLAGLPRAEADHGAGPQRLRTQLSDILALDGAVHSATAESPTMWARAGRLHSLVTGLLDLLVISKSIERNFRVDIVRDGSVSDEVELAVAKAVELLISIARTLRGDPAEESSQLRTLRPQVQALRRTLASHRTNHVVERRRIDLVNAMLGAAGATLTTYAALTGERDVAYTASYPTPVYALDRNYALAGALRAGFAVLLAGLLWINTDWQGGPLFVAFTSIAIALFAIRPDPRHTGIHFFASGVAGAGAALLFYMTIVPHTSHALSLSLAEGGVVFLAMVIASLLSNTFWASGFCLVFLVVSDPESLSHATVFTLSQHALGVLAGTALAVLAFHLVPSRRLERRWRKQRLQQVTATIMTTIISPAGQRPTRTHPAWQSSSIDTLVRIALPVASENEIAEYMAWIETGTEFLKLQDIARLKFLPPGARETIDTLFAELRVLGPRSWRPRLIAAETALRDTAFAGDQGVLSARAVMIELASLLENTAEGAVDVSDEGPRQHTQVEHNAPDERVRRSCQGDVA